MEGNSLRSQVAGAAVHGAGVSLTLTAGEKYSKYKERRNKMFYILCVFDSGHMKDLNIYIINISP